MCGRFVGYRRLEELIIHFPIDVSDVDVTENFNVAPTQQVLGVARYGDQNHLQQFHWGLVPFWAKDKSIGSRLINARSETVAKNPAFRNAFKKQRCLIVADGFYEWSGKKGQKQPMYITLPDGNPFAFAGLWNLWDKDGLYRSCSILTTEASESVMPIHNRMPVILKPEAYTPWLNPENQDIGSL